VLSAFERFPYGEVPGEHVTQVEKVEVVASARQAAVGAHDGGAGHDVALAVMAVCSMGERIASVHSRILRPSVAIHWGSRAAQTPDCGRRSRQHTLNPYDDRLQECLETVVARAWTNGVECLVRSRVGTLRAVNLVGPLELYRLDTAVFELDFLHDTGEISTSQRHRNVTNFASIFGVPAEESVIARSDYFSNVRVGASFAKLMVESRYHIFPRFVESDDSVVTLGVDADRIVNRLPVDVNGTVVAAKPVLRVGLVVIDEHSFGVR
jgi:hypothetical protein